jgi:hypothetical protein
MELHHSSRAGLYAHSILKGWSPNEHLGTRSFQSRLLGMLHDTTRVSILPTSIHCNKACRDLRLPKSFRIEATIKMHPIGLRHFHDLVPLPQFEEEDSGFYFFLAQISLRKFLTQTLEVVGYLVGRVVFAPVVTGELRKQVREWYDHLPSIVRFPLDSTPLFDSRKSFLRGQYIALHVVLGWPSVLEIIKGDGEAINQDQETQLVIRDQAQDCIRSSALFLSIADEQLMGRKMGTHFTLYA